MDAERGEERERKGGGKESKKTGGWFKSGRRGECRGMSAKDDDNTRRTCTYAFNIQEMHIKCVSTFKFLPNATP